MRLDPRKQIGADRGLLVRFLPLPTSPATLAACRSPTHLSPQFSGHRDGRVRDPIGQEWLLSQMVEEVASDEMQRRGDAMVTKS
jgi:hypothetical protein